MRLLWNKLHKLGDILHLPDMPNWLLFGMVFIMLLRIPSFFEPYYYGDEMIYLTMGQGVQQGVTLYKDLHDNKPPLLYLTAAIASNLFWFKAILAFWSLVTVYYFYRLSEKIFKGKDKPVKISTLVFAVLTTIPLLEGNTVNAELFMIGPSIIAFLILLDENLKISKVFWAGFLFGIATLFKVPAVFEVPVIVIYWLTTDLKNWRKTIKNVFVLGLGVLAPIAVSIIYYLLAGAGPEYVKAAFLQNVGYLSSFRPDDAQKSFFAKNAPLITRAMIVVLGSLILFIKRAKLSKRFIFLCLWVIFALFAVTLSERPYPHYLIQNVAPMAILMAMFFTEETFDQVLVIIPLVLSFLVPVYYRFYFYPTSSYYLRFVDFAADKITKTQYFQSFSASTNRNYEIAEFIANSSHPKDKVFMWDPDSAAVYALSKRLPPIKYTVPYHVADFSNRSDTANAVMENPPKFIVMVSGHPLPEIENFLRKRYLLINQIGNANIYSRLDLVR